MTTEHPAIELEVVSDVACPWCFIAHRRLARILASEPETAAGTTIRWRAFQLQPELPPDGLAAGPFFEAKFGGPDRVRAVRARVAEAGAAEGITFAFERQARVFNTRLAHRVMSLVQEDGDATPVMDALFAANFEEGLDLGDRETLLGRLVSGGLLDARDADRLHARLDAGDGEAAVDEDLRFAAAIGVSGVPFMIANRRIALSGAQPEAVVRELLARAVAPEATVA
jgi:predicted DsbA family dithiol-disulfide isomerase